MEIELTRHDDCDLVVLGGNVLAPDVPILEATLRRLQDVGRYQVLLDMRACTYIGSSGLSCLINFADSCRRWNRGDLYLIAPHDSIRNVLQIAGLLSETRSFFQIYDTVHEGAAAFATFSG